MVKAIVALVLATAAPFARASAHALHTSMTQVTFDKSSNSVSVSIRAFADDLSAAAKAVGLSRHDYALRAFKLKDARGAAIGLTACGEKRVGDLIWLCFTGRAATGLSNCTVASSIMFERYRDQVNIITAILPRGSKSLIFTQGEGFKRI